MDLTTKQIMSYATSPKNPGKTYGSIENGFQVAKYRRERKQYWMGQGFDFVESLRKAESDVVAKFGHPNVSH